MQIQSLERQKCKWYVKKMYLRRYCMILNNLIDTCAIEYCISIQDLELIHYCGVDTFDNPTHNTTSKGPNLSIYTLFSLLMQILMLIDPKECITYLHLLTYSLSGYQCITFSAFFPPNYLYTLKCWSTTMDKSLPCPSYAQLKFARPLDHSPLWPSGRYDSVVRPLCNRL